MGRKKPSGCCVLCGIWRPVLHRDHIVPKHRGGGNESSNIQEICANCHQDKTAIELTLVLKGRRCSDETKAKISAANKGHSVSEETRAKISAAAKAALASPEMRRRLSESQKELNRNRSGPHPNLGRKLNLSPEEYERRVNRLRKYRFTVGSRHSEEAKAKMSDSHLLLWRQKDAI